MIQLLPVTEQSLIRRLNRAYGVEATHAYACIEKKEIKATCLYTTEKGKAEILNVSTVEEDVADGLLRAVFASLAQVKIDTVSFGKSVDMSLIQKLQFCEEGMTQSYSLNEILNTHHCGG